MAPAFYQKLRYMVVDKYHARPTGPYQFIVRQPTEGRSNNGGLRFGEMEKDTILSNGGAFTLKDRLIDQSDSYLTPICNKCNNIAQRNDNEMSKTFVLFENSHDISHYCKVCKTGKHVYDVKIPYATKLLMQELGAINISVKPKLKDADSI
jgi:DNA-directed RNA polymerase beta subunit